MTRHDAQMAAERDLCAAHPAIPSFAVIEGKGWTIRTTSAIHAQPQLQCYAYRLDCDDGSFVYSGDSGPSRRIGELAKDGGRAATMGAAGRTRALEEFSQSRCTDRIEALYREALNLREHEGWSYKRIAEHYELTLPAAEMLVFGFLKRIVWIADCACSAVRKTFSGSGTMNS